MIIAVAPAALRDVSDRARRTASGLSTALVELSTGVEPLGRQWTGEAATAFAEHHRRWQEAASGIVGTLTELVQRVDTAHANYAAATSVNLDIWAPAGGMLVPGARGDEGIEAEIEDVRTTAAVLVRIADELAEAWVRLAAGLAGTASMAGDDAVGAGFGADHDGMATVLWRGWRQSVIMMGAIGGGLAATGNNIVEAERKSGGGPVAEIAAVPVAVPAPAPPPAATGDNGSAAFESWLPILATHWPRADPARLRAAAQPWRASAAAALDTAGRADAAVAALVAANPDPALYRMRRFTDGVLADRASGLFGVLADGSQQVAQACRLLADATDETRERMRAETIRVLGGGEWYHALGTLLDAVATRGAAKYVAAAADLPMLDLLLSGLAAAHARRVAEIRTLICAAAADRVAAFTATAPPRAGVACVAGVPQPRRDGETERTALITEAQAEGRKMSATAVVTITRLPGGRVVWLERGRPTAGLAHILRARRISDFLGIGVAPTEIPDVAMRALTTGTFVGHTKNDGGDVYDVDIAGVRRRIAVVVGSNGFIVTAYPYGGPIVTTRPQDAPLQGGPP